MNYSPLFLTDFYKTGHKEQYPEGTNLIFTNFTPRKSKILGINHSVFYGLLYFIEKYLMNEFNEILFPYTNKRANRMNNGSLDSEWHADHMADFYRKVMKETLGKHIDAAHIEKLVNLGYLPIAIYALPELSIVPCGVPALVMFNTHPDFFWLPNYLETLLSCTLWGACTSATHASRFRVLLDHYAHLTSDIPDFVDWQAHDFSFRGMFGLEAAVISGMAHLEYFKGTDTIPAILAQHLWQDKEFNCGGSVSATEHSVMSAGGKENELATYARLITEIYPSGIISIVSDTWDLWNVLRNILPKLKNIIMERDGKVVIRPDSGDPVDIICGTGKHITKCNHSKYLYDVNEMGLIESLWEIFGGTINSKGYKQLDPHIGAIYGDSITHERCKEICERLRQKGFASTNIVFGIGSYTYQYNTRDTLGWAMKSTYCEIYGKGRAITKDPITDDGTKKSHSGILKVIKVEGAHGYHYQVKQNQTWDEFYSQDNQLKLAFKDGVNYL